MNDVSIKQFSVVDGATDDQGNTTLATFDAKVQSIVFSGCTIVRLRSGRIGVFPPMLNARSVGRKAVWFDDRELWQEFASKALEVYRAVSGVQLTADYDGEDGSDLSHRGLHCHTAKARPPIAESAWLTQDTSDWFLTPRERAERERWARYR